MLIRTLGKRDHRLLLIFLAVEFAVAVLNQQQSDITFSNDFTVIMAN